MIFIAFWGPSIVLKDGHYSQQYSVTSFTEFTEKNVQTNHRILVTRIRNVEYWHRCWGVSCHIHNSVQYPSFLTQILVFCSLWYEIRFKSLREFKLTIAGQIGLSTDIWFTKVGSGWRNLTLNFNSVSVNFFGSHQLLSRRICP